jgi:hypothetical protein
MSTEPVLAPTVDIDPPASFYLGREYDPVAKQLLDKPVMYEAQHLTTHGVVVGMTGSGKTGLCVSILEEAAIDGFPCIIVDLKGDLCNMLLTFPELRPEDFEPWVDPDAARRKKLTVPEFAAKTAEQWKQGLADWWQQPERINRLRNSSQWRIYTPGSEAGRSLSILQSFSAPRGQISRELLNEKVEATTTAVLGLTGVSNDPLQSREHVLIANLLLNAWLTGKDMDLPRLITQIQMPPLTKIGAFDMDTFYPEQERLKLAVALNNILASPSFSTWITGEPLDLAKMTRSPDGRPRQLIFYLAHLDEQQRMFMLSLLLTEILAWTRSLPGTTSLRGLVYIDEVAGYLPPHPGNPPTKRPLLTLMKQARAFGVGVLLATQNPMDLDYKALTNAGTWFVGKLQTDRDKMRLLEGLEGVAAAQGTLTDKAYLDKLISSLGNRIFLLHSVHTGQPKVFQTRWALSYLAGPVTREQLKQLPLPPEEEAATAAPTPAEPAEKICRECQTQMPPVAKFCMECGTKLAPTQDTAEKDFKQTLHQSSHPGTPAATSHVPPVLPSGVVQFYLPVVPLAAKPGDATTTKLHYEPRLLGSAEVLFADNKRGLELRRHYRLLVPGPATGQVVSWTAADRVGEKILQAPDSTEAAWADVPKSINDPKKLKALEKGFAEFLYKQATARFFENKALDMFSQPEEDEQAFLARCKAAAQKASETELAKLKEKYRGPFAKLAERKQRANLESQTAQQAFDTLNQGGSLLGSIWSGVFGKGEDAAQIKQKQQATKRLQEARSEEEKILRDEQKLNADWQADVQKLAQKWQQKAAEVKEIRLTPKKSDIQVSHFGIAWTPFWQAGTGGGTQAVAAYVKDTGRM